MCLAVPVRISEIKSDILAVFESGGVQREVNIELTPSVQVGDYIILHVGYALSVLDTEEAKNLLDLHHEISR